MKVRIGITVRSTEQNSLYEAYSVQKAYVEALKSLETEIVFLYPKSQQQLQEDIKNLDGIMIVGGMDVSPSFYHEPNTHSSCENEEIDLLDIDVIRIALKQKKEILGICRGLQVINVALGGSLNQHIEGHRQKSLTQAHPIEIVENSLLSEIIQTHLYVNSFHHQSIKTLASMLKVSATAPDGTIEAVECDKLLAVQWHPERMRSLIDYQNFFKAFIKRCQKL